MLGVPGYAEATSTPASHMPRATASLPESIFLMDKGDSFFCEWGKTANSKDENGLENTVILNDLTARSKWQSAGLQFDIRHSRSPLLSSSPFSLLLSSSPFSTLCPLLLYSLSPPCYNFLTTLSFVL